MGRLQKRIVVTLLSLLTVYYAYKTIHAYDRRADGFSLDKITSTMTILPEWEVEVSPKDIQRANEILDQPFYYLGRGFQCYAFQSADSKYVLKFIRHQRLRLPDGVEYLPNFDFIQRWKKGKIAMNKRRANRLFTGFKVAFENVPEETAMVFVHPKKTIGQHKQVVIIDRIGTRYTIDMDNYEFVLQRKASTIEPVIEKLMAEGNLDGAKARIDQIFQLLADCAHKGIQDCDGALIRKHNMGFLEDRAIYIDTGQLCPRDYIKNKDFFVSDLNRLRPLQKWLQERYPALADYFVEAKNRTIENF